jgi:hypothetical protein
MGITVEIDGERHFGFFEVHGDLVAVWLPETATCGKREGLSPEDRAGQLLRDLVLEQAPAGSPARC